MVSIAEAEVNLFGTELPNFDEIKKLSLFVNCSEINKLQFAKEVQQHFADDLSAGIGLFILGRNTEAIEKFQKSKDCMEKFIYLGYAFRELEQYDKAIKSFEQAGKKQADPLMVTLEKAAAMRKANMLNEAAKELKECANFEKVSAEYHFQLGKLNDAQGFYDQAVDNYTISRELDPNHLEALFQLAYAFDLRGDDKTARAYYIQLIKETPTHINALLNLAVLYEDASEYDKALNCVDVVLNSHPNHKKALLFMKDIESSKIMVYDEEIEKWLEEYKKTGKEPGLPEV